ncbi:MAG: TIGR01777 family oxidoreductase [Verrucomicrobiota bacterium]|nr:TIGR01777 family oxidoreductase [Verrucomicrobiota bacterium]
MKILIPGGSGQVGTILARAFRRDGHEVIVLSRKALTAKPWRVMQWDGRTSTGWADELEGTDVIINLAGRSVNCRYHARNRREIMQSRIDSTRAVGAAIRQAAKPPRLWLQASTATIYAHRFDAANDEQTGILGGEEPDAPDTWRFSIDVAKSWERAATEGETLPHTRQILMRSAITLSPEAGGIFDTLLSLVRHGLGGRAGDGRQFISWIHEADFVRAVYWLIEHEQLSGSVNLAAPNPLPNEQFMRVLREAWGIRSGLPAPTLLLELGAIFLRTETELILKSRRVIPSQLLGDGFIFDFPNWAQAAIDLCSRWKQQHGKRTTR